MDKTQIDAPVDTTLAGIEDVQGSDFPAAQPVEADIVSVTDNTTTKTVSAVTVAQQNAGAAPVVNYSGIATSDEINIDTLNKGSESLKQSVNEALSTLHQAVNQALVGVSGDTQSAISGLVNDINQKFSALKGEQSTLIGDVNLQVAGLVGDINAAFRLIAEKEQAQSNAVAAKINTVKAQANAQDLVLKSAIDEVVLRIQALDDAYATDSELAAKVAAVNELIKSLRETDLDFVTGLRQTVTEINMLERHKSKAIMIAASNGVYNFNLLGEGMEEAILPDDYRLSLVVKDNIKVSAEVINKTKDGFDIKMMSKGVHFVPQPVDCSVTPVGLDVTIMYDKKNALTFNVDTLNTSFVTSGAGTDINSI